MGISAAAFFPSLFLSLSTRMTTKKMISTRYYYSSSCSSSGASNSFSISISSSCSKLILSRIKAISDQSNDDPFLQSAVDAASLRFLESFRPHPLVIDPYAGCLVPPLMRDAELSASTTSTNHYCIATKFIDDKLLNTINHVGVYWQIVLLTDGMDTRPYRLNWPRLTMIFNISPRRVFQVASEKLKGMGAKVSRSCILLHIPLESSDIKQSLCGKGFDGNKPSVWIFQGLPVPSLESFQEILSVVSSLAAKGSIFIGEFPICLAASELEVKESLEKLFMSNGFNVDIIACDEIARKMHLDPPPGDYRNVIFIAEQLQFSDDQMEVWRREFQRIEEEGDEEGFEEL